MDKKRPSEPSQTTADVMRSLPIGVMTFRLDLPETLTLVEANAAAVAMVLGAASDGIGMRFEELWPPRMVEKIKPAILETAGGGTPYENEVVLRGDGGIRHAFRMHGFAIPDRKVVIAFEEITEQRRAEESLARSEAQFRSLVEDLSDVVFAADADGVITYVSPAITELLGYHPDEVVGRPYADFARPGSVPSMSEIAAWFASTPPEAPVEYQLVSKAGEAVWARASAHLLYDADGRTVGIHGVLSDITAKRRDEEVLERARRDMDLVLNATSDCLAYYALDHTVQWVNRAAMRAIGKTADAIVGRPCYEVWCCADRHAGACAVRRVTETERPSDVRVKTPSGQTYVVRAYPAFAEGRLVGVVESTVDITASERAREERERMEAQLRQSQKLESIGTLASGIAHEVNNPLTGMVNYAELIAMRVQDDQLRAFAEGIQEEGARVAGIVRNLLSFARQDSGETTAAAPARLVETTLLLVRALLAKDGVDLRVDVPDDLPCVACRPQQIEQVLLNLLMNARDAVNERFPGQAVPEKWIALRGRRVHDGGILRVRLTVEDNGTGIPEAIRERVFDPFFTTKPRDRGTGLGLSVSYGIVRDHGGRLWIESLSEPRGATAAHIDLPAIGAQGENAGAGGGAG